MADVDSTSPTNVVALPAQSLERIAQGESATPVALQFPAYITAEQAQAAAALLALTAQAEYALALPHLRQKTGTKKERVSKTKLADRAALFRG